MYKIEINNCNNIGHSVINIEPGKLNIAFGVNGTGKTTISKAIQFAHSPEEIKKLQPFYTERNPQVMIHSKNSIRTVLVYDDQFVNNIVFQADEVIQNSFEVFIKTPDYEEKKKQLEKYLLSLNSIVRDEEILKMMKTFDSLLNRLKQNSNGEFTNKGTFKSIASENTVFNPPKKLYDYKDFFESDNNVQWVEWKLKGLAFDNYDRCPYCGCKLNITTHQLQTDEFKNTFTKADAKNVVDFLSLLEDVKDCILNEEYKKLVSYVKKRISKRYH